MVLLEFAYLDCWKLPRIARWGPPAEEAAMQRIVMLLLTMAVIVFVIFEENRRAEASVARRHPQLLRRAGARPSPQYPEILDHIQSVGLLAMLAGFATIVAAFFLYSLVTMYVGVGVCLIATVLYAGAIGVRVHLGKTWDADQGTRSRHG